MRKPSQVDILRDRSYMALGAASNAPINKHKEETKEREKETSRYPKGKEGVNGI